MMMRNFLKASLLFTLAFAATNSTEDADVDVEKKDTEVKKNDTKITVVSKDDIKASAVWIDYAMLLDNYPKDIGKNGSDINLNGAVNMFIKPIKSFQKSINDEDVTNEERKSTLIGMLKYLSNDTAFKDANVTEEEWKDFGMSNSVIRRKSVAKVLEVRTTLIKGIKKERHVKKLKEKYVKRIQKYIKSIEAMDKDAIKKTVAADGIDWDLFQKRYFDLLKNVVAVNPKKLGKPCRNYLASWLRTGNDDEATFSKLKTQGEKEKKSMSGRIKKMFRSDASSLKYSTATLLVAFVALMFTL